MFSIFDSICSTLYVCTSSILLDCPSFSTLIFSLTSTLQSLFIPTLSFCFSHVFLGSFSRDSKDFFVSFSSNCRSLSFKSNSLSFINFLCLINSNPAIIPSIFLVFLILCFNLSSNLWFLLFLFLNLSGCLEILAITCFLGFDFPIVFSSIFSFFIGFSTSIISSFLACSTIGCRISFTTFSSIDCTIGRAISFSTSSFNVCVIGSSISKIISFSPCSITGFSSIFSFW